MENEAQFHLVTAYSTTLPLLHLRHRHFTYVIWRAAPGLFYFHSQYLLDGPGGSSGKELDYGLDSPGSISAGERMEIFIHSFVSRLAQELIQPPI